MSSLKTSNLTSFFKQSSAGLKLVALGLMVVSLALMAAAAPTSAKEGSADALRVAPVRSDVRVKPGQSKVVKLQVSNLTEHVVSLNPVQNDFIAGDEKGTPALILDADKSAPTHSLKQFLKPIKKITLQPKETKTVSVKISVPKDAQAGGYFGAIQFTPSVPGSGGQVNLNTHVASLILLTVEGNLVEKLAITDFQIEKDEKTSVFFSDAANIMAKIRFENKGNVQVGPHGELAVKKGGKVIASHKFNTEEPTEMTLPDSARRWDVPLKGIGGFGKYEVLGTFSYGENNQTIEASTSFWIIPLWVQLAILAVLLLVAALVIAIPFTLKRKRRQTRR